METRRTEQLRALARYETTFAQPGFTFGRWADVTPDRDGVMQMPWFECSATAEAFIEEACALGWVVDFDWMSWSASLEGQALLADPGLVADASVDDLSRLLTACIRGDHFSEGRLAQAFETGLLGAIVRRAAELAG